MKSTYRFGSTRPRYFKEPKNKRRVRLTRRRSQRVHFRSKSATTSLKKAGREVWRGLKWGAFLAAVTCGAFACYDFWMTSKWVRIAHIDFQGEFPPALKSHFPLHRGQNIFTINPRRLEREILANYDELKRVTLTRTLRREIRVTGDYRQPIGLIGDHGKLRAMDEEGHLFDAQGTSALTARLPLLDRSIPRKQWPLLAGAIQFTKSQLAEFYFLLRRLEIDKMGEFRFELRNGVSVRWGELKVEDVIEKGEKILEVLKRFSPSRTPATLMFVTKERIVMDSNWVEKK